MEKQSHSFLTIIIMLSMASNIFSAANPDTSKIMPYIYAKPQMKYENALVPTGYFNPENFDATITAAQEEAEKIRIVIEVNDKDNPSTQIREARTKSKVLSSSLQIQELYLYRFTNKESQREALNHWHAASIASRKALEEIDPQALIPSMRNALKDEVQAPGTKQNLIDRGRSLYNDLNAKKISYQRLKTEEEEFLTLYEKLLKHKTFSVAAQDLLGHAKNMLADAAKKPTTREATGYVMGATAAYVADRLTFYGRSLFAKFVCDGKQRIA